jgi:hypothetical protein
LKTTDLETEKVAVIDWFIKHDVKSISPQTSIFLSDVADAVKAEIAKDPETPNAIRMYAVALDMVARAGHMQQGIVIKKLELLLTKTKD